MRGGMRPRMKIGESSYRRFLAGEEGAFDTVIDTYHESLIFFIRRYVRSLDDAEDLAEDCFVELLVHPYRYHFKGSLKTYLFTIARNKAVDYLRHHSLIETIPTDAPSEKSAAYESFEHRVLQNERRKAVDDAVGRLNEAMRTVIHLIYFEEMSYEEAGRVMGKSRKQVENLAYRARKELRAILTEEGWNDEGQD